MGPARFPTNSSISTQNVLTRLIEEWKKKLDKNYVVGSILMDLSKAFDCVPHDLIIAKLAAYGFEIDALQYILSYLTEREQATRINGIYSLFQTLLSGVPQGSILGPIIFNIFINDLFLFIINSSIHNYADDNTISCFSNSIKNVLNVLESDANIALSWLKENKMIANPEKFHCIILTKNKADNSDLDCKIGSKVIKTEQKVKLLGITIDNKLKFDEHVSGICRKASAQLNALSRLNKFLSMEAKTILIQSFIYAHFNYCSLIWHYSSSKSINKVEMIQKRALRFIFNDNSSSYEELLIKAKKNVMSINRLRTLCIEIFKTINNMNPPFMKEIFTVKNCNKTVRQQHKNNLEIKVTKTATFGTKSLTSLGPKVWNSLPPHLKLCERLPVFKKMIKHWDGTKCLCDKCKEKF